MRKQEPDSSAAVTTEDLLRAALRGERRRKRPRPPPGGPRHSFSCEGQGGEDGGGKEGHTSMSRPIHGTEGRN